MRDCRHRYIVIDDDPGDIEILRRHLEQISAGTAEVTEFREPESALAELQFRDVDLIFIDYVLGEQTGLEVFQAIRDLGCDCPAVILTGQGSESIAVEAMKAGVADYIVKGSLTGTVCSAWWRMRSPSLSSSGSCGSSRGGLRSCPEPTI